MADHIPLELHDCVKVPSPEKYNGRREPDAIRSWLYEITNYATFHGITEAQTIALIPFYLEGTAASWWAAKRVAREIPLTWAAVETMFNAEFLPQNYVNRLRTRLYNLRQNTSVAAYSATFRQIILNLPAMDQGLLVHLYLQGLKPQTRLEVELCAPETLNEAEVQALRVDDIMFAKTNRPTFPGKPNFPNVPRPGKPNGNPLNNLDAKKKPLPKLTDAERRRLSALGACFKCQQVGHMANACPTRTQNNNYQPARRPLNVNALDAATSTSENVLRQ